MNRAQGRKIKTMHLCFHTFGLFNIGNVMLDGRRLLILENVTKFMRWGVMEHFIVSKKEKTKKFDFWLPFKNFVIYK